RDHSQANFFELRARMNFFMNRTILHRYRLYRLSHGPAPALIHFGGGGASHAQTDNSARSSLDSRENPGSLTTAPAIRYLFHPKMPGAQRPSGRDTASA